MIAACLLGRLYSITADEAIERMRMGHTGRGDVIHARTRNMNTKQTITVPDTANQQQLIRQILSISEEIYKSIHRKDEDSHIMERRTVRRGIGVPTFNPPEIDPFGPKTKKQRRIAESHMGKAIQALDEKSATVAREDGGEMQIRSEETVGHNEEKTEGTRPKSAIVSDAGAQGTNNEERKEKAKKAKKKKKKKKKRKTKGESKPFISRLGEEQ